MIVNVAKTFPKAFGVSRLNALVKQISLHSIIYS